MPAARCEPSAFVARAVVSGVSRAIARSRVLLIVSAKLNFRTIVLHRRPKSPILADAPFPSGSQCIFEMAK